MTLIIKDNRATLEFENISNALLHLYFNKGKLESYSFTNTDCEIEVDVILTDTYLLKSTLTLANYAIRGEKNTLFSDNDIDEANTIVYVCIPKDAINGDPIHIHQCTNNLEDDAGGLAYALELLECNKISEILKITFENNLI